MEYNFDIEKLMPAIQYYASRGSFILEIGPAKGNGSTVALSNGLQSNNAKDKLFISVDIRDYMEFKPDLPYWHLVLGDSRLLETVDKVREICGNRVPDVIFIDTDHTYEQMSVELVTWAQLAGDKTVWLFHDTYMAGQYNSMTDAIKEFAKLNDWLYDDVTIESHGLGAMKKA